MGASSLLLVLLSVLFLSSATAAAGASDDGQSPTHLHFFFHEIFSSVPNSTITQLTPPRAGNSNGSFFGYTLAVDDMLREGADPSSRLIGRLQGLAVGASLSDGAFLTVIDFVFMDGAYNGSSLQVFGRTVAGLTAVMERPIVGGTGAFRMARGYMLSKMVLSPDPNNLLVLEFDAYVWH